MIFSYFNVKIFITRSNSNRRFYKWKLSFYNFYRWVTNVDFASIEYRFLIYIYIHDATFNIFYIMSVIMRRKSTFHNQCIHSILSNYFTLQSFFRKYNVRSSRNATIHSSNIATHVHSNSLRFAHFKTSKILSQFSCLISFLFISFLELMQNLCQVKIHSKLKNWVWNTRVVNFLITKTIDFNLRCKWNMRCAIRIGMIEISL